MAALKNEYTFDGLSFGSGDKVPAFSTCAYRFYTANTGNQRLVVMAIANPERL